MIHQTWSSLTIDDGIEEHRPSGFNRATGNRLVTVNAVSGHALLGCMRAHGSDWWIEFSGEYINGIPGQEDLDEYLETLTPVPYLGPPVFDDTGMEIAPPTSGGEGMPRPRATDAELRANVAAALKRR